MELRDIIIEQQEPNADRSGFITKITQLIGYDGDQLSEHGLTLHNENGPAYIVSYIGGSVVIEAWYSYGLLHRVDGPAVIPYHKLGEPEYCLLGKRVSKENFYTLGFIDAFIIEHS